VEFVKVDVFAVLAGIVTPRRAPKRTHEIRRPSPTPGMPPAGWEMRTLLMTRSARSNRGNVSRDRVTHGYRGGVDSIDNVLPSNRGRGRERDE